MYFAHGTLLKNPLGDAFGRSIAEPLEGSRQGFLGASLGDLLWAHVGVPLGVIQGSLGGTIGEIRGGSLWASLGDSIGWPVGEPLKRGVRFKKSVWPKISWTDSVHKIEQTAERSSISLDGIRTRKFWPCGFVESHRSPQWVPTDPPNGPSKGHTTGALTNLPNGRPKGHPKRPPKVTPT